MSALDHFRLLRADARTEIHDLTLDSRAAGEGSLFLALHGAREDGADYAKEAAARGAVCVVTEHAAEGVPCVLVPDAHEAAAKLAARWYGEPAGRMTVVGVTGTNGKTTTTYLLKQLLERCLGAKVGLIGTNQNMIGDAVLPAERTTPDALTLQRLLREMADAGCTHVVMEVSSHALVQRRAGAIDFALGVFTNLTQDHLDYHGTMEAYCDAKARLFRQCRAAAVNGDDPWTPRLLENVTCPVTRFGQGLANDLVGWDAHYCADRVSFTACSDSEHIPVTLHIPGAFSLYNALAALAADNSDAATLQSKTLYVRIAAVTTSSIILEWEQAGDVSQYTVAIEEEGDPSRSARFTYDWSKASGYGSIPLRFAFNYVGTEWASAALSPSASYRLRVKAGAADSDSAWSNDITGTVARRTAPAGEVFYEDFDRFMGGDAVMTAVGVKSAKKVTSEAGLSTMLTEFTYTDWSAGGGAMNAGSGTYGDPYRLMFFKDDGWETGALVTGNGVHNAFCGSFRLGGDNANQSYIQTPAMSGLTAAANVTVTFKTAVNVWTAASTTAPAVVFKAGWCRDQFESMELYVVHGDGTKVHDRGRRCRERAGVEIAQRRDRGAAAYRQADVHQRRRQEEPLLHRRDIGRQELTPFVL